MGNREKTKEPIKKVIKKWYAVDKLPNPRTDTSYGMGLGDTIQEALDDFIEDNEKAPKYYAFKIELLGEVKQTLEIVK